MKNALVLFICMIITAMANAFTVRTFSPAIKVTKQASKSIDLNNDGTDDIIIDFTTGFQIITLFEKWEFEEQAGNTGNTIAYPCGAVMDSTGVYGTLLGLTPFYNKVAYVSLRKNCNSTLKYYGWLKLSLNDGGIGGEYVELYACGYQSDGSCLVGTTYPKIHAGEDECYIASGIETIPALPAVTFTASNIIIESPTPHTYSIWSAEGRLMEQGQTQQPYTEVPVGHLPQGFYVLGLHDNTLRKTYNFSVVK